MRVYIAQNEQGTVVESSADFYSSRLTRKQRANTFVDELLKDSEFKKYTKKKFMVSSDFCACSSLLTGL